MDNQTEKYYLKNARLNFSNEVDKHNLPIAASIFCNKESEYVFPLQTKIVLFFVKIWYWMRYWLWMQIRYWQPNRIKRVLSKKETGDDLPF
jgi:hypothetical protein